MIVSTKGRYALRMMIDLAIQGGTKWVSLKEISSRQEISVKYLEQIVSGLCKAGLLHSLRGPQGGYKLVKETSQYTTGEILHAIEGPMVPVSCLSNDKKPCARLDVCPTLSYWKNLEVVISNYMESVTLQDLVEEAQIKGADHYVI